MNTSRNSNPLLPVAIIGIGPIFPKGYGEKQFSGLIVRGLDAIQKIPETHWSPGDYFDSDPQRPDHVYAKRGGFISPVSFDPSEFGIPPNSIQATDTSQLLGLQAAEMALKNAGYGKAGKAFDRDRTSVILGVTGTQELVIPLSSRLGHPHWKKAMQKAGLPDATIDEVTQSISESYLPWQENSFPGLLGNVVAGRICNRLDFGGTNCVVDAACASSMSALNLALLELSSGRADMVISGGVDTLNDIFMHMCFSKTKILSPTGDIRPFSKNADGTLLGEGIGIVVLKRLVDAEKDGDRIYAVIKSIGTSSDGKSQSIYAPNKDGQVKALTNAYRDADVDPSTVELVEAHGTGTRVGDQVEFQALRQVLDASRNPEQPPCAVGSIKSQIGHTKAAAGAAGLIKAALALYHKTLPPTLKAGEPDPALGIQDSRFYLPDHAIPWFPRSNHPRRAGVSAFGFGGSNFHMVLEEYSPEKSSILWDGSVEIFTLSGDTRLDILDRIRNLDVKLAESKVPAVFSQAAAATRATFSHKHPFRLAFAVETDPSSPGVPPGFLSSVAEAIEKNSQKNNFQLGNVFWGNTRGGKIGFLFPGQGSQYVGMGRELVVRFPETFQAVADANSIWKEFGRLNDYIWPATSGKASPRQEAALRDTRIAQPAIGAISAAMLRLLSLFNISPEAVCGHSFGELSALQAAGRLKFEDYISLAGLRGELMSNAGKGREKGAMLAIQAPLSQIKSLLASSGVTGVVLANKNAPEQGVVSGESAAVEKLIPICRERGIRTVKLPVSAAFHSSFVQQARKPFAAALEKIDFFPSKIPVFANTSALPYPDSVAETRKILADQIIHPVNFHGNILNMYESGVRTFIEVGPKNVLSGLVRATLQNRDVHILSVDHSAGKRPGLLDFACVLCHLLSLGYPVDLAKWEETTETGPAPRMTVAVSGANPKPKGIDLPRTTPESRPEPVKVTESRTIAADIGTISAGKTRRELPSSTKDQQSLSKGQPNMVMNRTPPGYTAGNEALKAVQEGLKSLQRLQEQTAEAHKQFLKTQAEANRSLLAVIQQTGILANAAPEIFSALSPRPEDFDQAAPREDSAIAQPPLKTKASSPLNQAAAEAVRTAEPGMTPPSHDGANPVPASNPAGENIEQVLLHVVSELTGYPLETLGLDMDIEADLGIDSIKRVEILSAFEEKMPAVPPVSPDVMGTLKTLGQICAHLRQQPSQPDNKTATDMSDTAETGIEQVLLHVVSELTGYPLETLGLDMDIEADLGIDSIKRVEILSAFEEKMPAVPPVSPDVMGTLKTLGQISAYLENSSVEPAPALSDKGHPETAVTIAVEKTPETAAPLSRLVVQLNANSSIQRITTVFPEDRSFYIIGQHADLGRALKTELESRKISAVYMDQKDITDKPFNKPPSGLIILAGRPSQSSSYDWKAGSNFLKRAFYLAQRFSRDLHQSSNSAPAFFGTVSFMDGAFGFRQKGFHDPFQGGLAGLAKTADLEWGSVCCRAFDIDPSWQQWKNMAKTLADEIEMPDAHNKEIGLQKSSRCVLSLSAATMDCRADSHIDLQPGDVVVITGGARGITAQAAKALGKAISPTLVLLGRSPQPICEPDWLAALELPSEIKKALLENEFRGSVKSPSVLEAAYCRHMANREIAATLKDLESSGTTVIYRSVDIRNKEKVRRILDSVSTKFGPVRAVIHGAGVLEDRRISDKKPEQFDRVFDTKVAGLQSLLDALQDAPLKALVMFSSISARMGNPGQADYAMANEVLNKIAALEARKRESCKVLSINWGPWDGGMVSDSLKKEFAQRNIGLIPIDKGVEFLLEELAFDRNGPVEVVAGSLMAADSAAAPADGSSADLRKSDLEKNTVNSMVTAFQRDIGMATCPVLSSHIIDGKPVVPFALMAEWIGHGALHENPGLQLYGIDNMRLLKGIRLENGNRTIRLLAGKAKRSGDRFHVDVEIRNGQPDAEVIHSRAMAILADGPASAPSLTLSDFSSLLDGHPYYRSIQDVYDKILFHGNDLRGIRSIGCCSAEGMSATLCPSPAPEAWMKQPPRSRWISDPLIIDAAYQMASVWCYENHGNVSLPSFYASYRQFRKAFPKDDVTAVFTVSNVSMHKVTGEFCFFDSKGVMIASINGYEAIMDASLFKSFKPEYARSA